MTLNGNQLRYGAAAQAFHWVTVVLVAAGYILSAGGSEARVYAPQRAAQLTLHETIGVVMFALVLLRLVWRTVDQRPDDPPMAIWMRWSSRAVHALLYGLLLATPLSAVAGAWLEGHPLYLQGIGAIGPLGWRNHDLGAALAEIHGWLGNALVWIAGFHAAAALYHHFVLKDRVLASMLPWSAGR